MFWKKLKNTLLSERTQALLLYLAVTIVNGVFPNLNLNVPAVPDSDLTPLTLLAGVASSYVIGTSVRKPSGTATPDDKSNA